MVRLCAPGGRPVLGYDVDPRGGRIIVNEEEAAMVRAIFDLYLEHEALLPVTEELEKRGWRNKQWKTKKGREAGGGPLDTSNLYNLLTNGVIERFFRTAKENYLWLEHFTDLIDARERIGAWIEEYNTRWPIGRLGYKTPRQTRLEIMAAMAPAEVA